ncbi:MAG TPA: GNAT family N-acetyltransferase [Oligoflexia bacterium]|nr:GNAT family N-acetyltransferase [Oligoflexia bacterium]
MGNSEQFNSAGLRFGEVCYGYYLMTHPERQNEGCATTLICEAIGLAALWGFDSFVVDLAINPPLERAVRLFERQGFRPTAHLVHDEMGNEWRQYLLPLGGREVDLGDYGFVIGVK